MNYVDQLRQSRGKSQVAFAEFALATRGRSAHLFCFFEGKDNDYYVPRIKQFTNDYSIIRCGGKQPVLGVHALITSIEEYRHYKLAFFVDRDFDASIGAKTPPIFETPCYSVENFYVSVSAFKEILKNELHLSEVSDSDFAELASLYEQRQQEFHEAVLLFNSWYACLMERRERAGLPAGASLSENLPKGFVEISLDEVKSFYDLQKIREAFPNAPAVEEVDIERKKQFFRGTAMHLAFRGKYELEFLIRLLREILKDARTERRVVSSKLDFAFGDAGGLNQAQALNIFQTSAETPESLLEYLATVTQNGPALPGAPARPDPPGPLIGGEGRCGSA